MYIFCVSIHVYYHAHFNCVSRKLVIPAECLNCKVDLLLHMFICCTDMWHVNKILTYLLTYSLKLKKKGGGGVGGGKKEQILDFLDAVSWHKCEYCRKSLITCINSSIMCVYLSPDAIWVSILFDRKGWDQNNRKLGIYIFGGLFTVWSWMRTNESLCLSTIPLLSENLELKNESCFWESKDAPSRPAPSSSAS